MASCEIEDQNMEDLANLLHQREQWAMDGDDLCTEAQWTDLIDNPLILQGVCDMGFEKPSVVQCETIPKLCQEEKLSVLVEAPAGCGKTVAFTVAMLCHVDKSVNAIQSVCLCHTPELVKQAMETFQQLNALARVTVASLIDDKSQIPPDCQVIFARPLPLAKSIKAQKLDVSHVKIVIVDDADEVLKRTGVCFRPMEDLLKSLLPNTAQLGFFSATFPDAIAQEVQRLCGSRKLVKYQVRSLPKSISHWHIHQERENNFNFVGELLEKVDSGERILVFAGSKDKVRGLQDYLEHKSISSQTLSGGQDVTLEERDRVIHDFKEGTLKVLISSDLASRGLDVPELGLVINLDFPYRWVAEDGRSKRAGPDFDLYMHRAGRCGRFGRPGVVLNVYANDNERDSYERIFRQLGIEKAYHLVG